MLKIDPPKGDRRVLLHCCCAPCSSAILECMKANGIEVTLYYCNPNIYPSREYEIRRDEARRFADEMGVEFIEAEYHHQEWLEQVRGLEDQPERGSRCQECFRMRLRETARYASEHGFASFTTTLASSRWKSLEQINRAGKEAQETVEGTLFWDQNWRKGGLQERRNQLLREYGFYNQNYCGCEFSLKARLEKELEDSPGERPADASCHL